MNQETTASLLKAIDFNKPLEVSLVFDDSDEEKSSSDNQENTDTKLTALNLDGPLEISLIIDEECKQNAKSEDKKTNPTNIETDSQNGKGKGIVEPLNTGRLDECQEKHNTSLQGCETKRFKTMSIKTNTEKPNCKLSIDKLNERIFSEGENTNIKNPNKNYQNCDSQNTNSKVRNLETSNKAPEKSELKYVEKLNQQSSLTDKKPNNNQPKYNYNNALPLQHNTEEKQSGSTAISREHTKSQQNIWDTSANSRLKTLSRIEYNNIGNSIDQIFSKEYSVSQPSEQVNKAIIWNHCSNSNSNTCSLDGNSDSNTKSVPNNEYVDCDNYLTLMLKTVSEHLIVILQAHNCLVSTKAAVASKIPEAEQNFLKIKEHFYNLSYSTVSNIMLPQEQNTHFTEKFIKDCVTLSKNHFHYDQFLSLYKELIQWVKIKKQRISELPFGKSYETLKDANPILAKNLSKPLTTISDKTSLLDKNNGSVTSQDESVCIFSSGSNGRKITINVTPSLLNQQIQPNKIQPNTTNPLTKTTDTEICYGSKIIGSGMPRVRPSPYPRTQPTSIRCLMPSSNPGVFNQTTVSQASYYRPEESYRYFSPSQTSLEQSTINNWSPRSASLPFARQLPPPYSASSRSRSLRDMLGQAHPLTSSDLQQNHSFLTKTNPTNNSNLKNLLQNYNLPPKQAQITKLTPGLPKPHEMYSTPNRLPPNYNACPPTFSQQQQPTVQKAQEMRYTSSSGVLSYPTSFDVSTSRLSSIYGPASPGCDSLNNSPWQKTQESEIQEEHNRSVRCHSTDSGFASPFNLHSPTEMPVNKEVEDVPVTPLITHVTSLNPNAAYNNESLCRVCNKRTNLKCLGCYKVYYCSHLCQVTDWDVHGKECVPP